jgi:hypothetical protein
MRDYYNLKEELVLIEEDINQIQNKYPSMAELQFKAPAQYMEIIQLRIKAARIRVRIGNLLSSKLYENDKFVLKKPLH